MAGLLPVISQDIQKRADLKMLDSLPDWMNEAALHEALARHILCHALAPMQSDRHQSTIISCQFRTFAQFSACEMALPAGVDDLLGQSWMSHQAILLTWSGQVNFLDDRIRNCLLVGKNITVHKITLSTPLLPGKCSICQQRSISVCCICKNPSR